MPKKIKEEVVELKIVEPEVELVEPEVVEPTPREKAWEHFKKTMEKNNPEKFKRMSAAGELDKILDKFTFY